MSCDVGQSHVVMFASASDGAKAEEDASLILKRTELKALRYHFRDGDHALESVQKFLEKLSEKGSAYLQMWVNGEDGFAKKIEKS